MSSSRSTSGIQSQAPCDAGRVNAPAVAQDSSTRRLEPLLAVAGKLAGHFDLPTMLREVANAAVVVLEAERAAVWLYDAAADELVLEISHDMDPIRVPGDKGVVGACARSRKAINVPDCYADPRFDPAVDRRSGYRTRCLLALPLVDHLGVLVGVMQLLNKKVGVFDAQDESLALVLAAQCAIALQRVKMTQALLEGERMRRELEMAREVQASTLPSRMPSLTDYDLHGCSHPADSTGGDTFDLTQLDRGLLVVLGDATGHGIAPAISITQMQAMLRIAFRLGADLETTFRHVNNQLAETLPDDRFITAFVGVLDPVHHRLDFHSGGQGPILLYRAAGASWEELATTSFPLAAMPMPVARAASTVPLAPGDILVLLSDGIYEYRNAAGEYFGEARVRDLIQRNHAICTGDLAELLLDAVRGFAAGAPQEDDITLVLLKRDASGTSSRRFARSFDCLAPMAAWTAAFFARAAIEADLLVPVDTAIEELFTNMVKYGAGSKADVGITLHAIDRGVEVTMIDSGGDRFDVTARPPPDVSLPAEARVPGGLGVYLVQRIVEDLKYDYDASRRQSRITFRKTSESRTC